MNKKRWLIIGLAILLVLISGITSIGLTTESDGDTQTAMDRFNPYSMILGNQEPRPEVIEQGNTDEQILVIPIKGQIGVDASEYNHEAILSAIEQASQDESIKAVLLDIDTGGGAVYHTHEVYNAIMEMKKERGIPVMASMGSMAASGGYYIAMAADEVYASDNTITGSIGVIMGNYDVSELMEEYGIKQNTIKSGEMKDIMSLTREMTDDEREVLQNYVDEAFGVFLEVVEKGRPELSKDRIETLADGRIYSGNQAYNEGLVDELGYFQDALGALREQEGLEEAQVFQYVVEDPFDIFAGFPFAKNNKPFGDVPSLIQDIEQAQEITIEYRWKGAPAYGK